MQGNSSFRIKGLSLRLPFVGEQSFALRTPDSDASFATIIIGRNGSGKSMLLRDLTQTLRGIKRGAVRVWGDRAHSILTELSFTVDGDLFGVDESGKSTGFPQLSGARHPGPSRLIAISFTPFDKFPITSFGTDATFDDEADYVYLGFKAQGLRSPRARLLASIDHLAYRAVHAKKDQRVTNVLAAIGYGSRMEIKYSLSTALRQYLRDRQRDPTSVGDPERIRKYPENIHELVDLFNTYRMDDYFYELKASEYIVYDLDFKRGDVGRKSVFGPSVLRDLIGARVIKTVSVQLEKEESAQKVELLHLSSGELNLLSGFLGLAAHLREGCLVLIDEPENSLHPEWQIRYAEMLDAVLSRERGCHYIIATHSPLIVSGTAAHGSEVIRLDQEPVVSAGSSGSADATLVNVFEVVTKDSSYVRQLVLEALTLISEGEARSDRAVAIGGVLSDIEGQIGKDDPIKSVVEAVLVRLNE